MTRYAGSLVLDPHDRDDVVQETLARVLEVRGRLDPESLLAYALVTARHAVASQHRAAARARRHAPQLVDLREPERPDAAVLAWEERRALGSALARLPQARRDELLDHVVEERPLVVAGAGGSTKESAAAASRLARTRAKLRVDYVLALRRVELPTEVCRPVLLALTSADRRRQAALDAAGHLLTCRTCADLAEPLLRRDRAIAGLLPVALLVEGWRLLVAKARAQPAQTAIAWAAAVAGVAAVVAGVALLVHGDASPPPSTAAAPGATSVPTADPGALAARPCAPDLITASPGLDLPPAGWGSLLGTTVCGRGVPVDTVVGDETFWVTTRAGSPLLVQLVGTGESPQTVRDGALVTLRGSLARLRDSAAELGVTDDEGAARLAAEGVVLRVPYDSLRVES